MQHFYVTKIKITKKGNIFLEIHCYLPSTTIKFLFSLNELDFLYHFQRVYSGYLKWTTILNIHGCLYYFFWNFQYTFLLELSFLDTNSARGVFLFLLVFDLLCLFSCSNVVPVLQISLRNNIFMHNILSFYGFCMQIEILLELQNFVVRRSSFYFCRVWYNCYKYLIFAKFLYKSKLRYLPSI